VAADGRVYTSASELVSGEVGEDVAQFLWSSEQVRSAVALGVLVERDGSVAASGGLLIQALPGADAEELGRLGERVETLTDLSWRLAAGERVPDLLEWVVDKPITDWVVDSLHFGCLCSPEQSRQLLRVAPPAERRAWAREGGAEVVCHYCGTRYRFAADEVLA
jgi:molecular chaperone Hsp33